MTGYTITQADILKAATALAVGCLVLYGNGAVELGGPSPYEASPAGEANSKRPTGLGP